MTENNKLLINYVDIVCLLTCVIINSILKVKN